LHETKKKKGDEMRGNMMMQHYNLPISDKKDIKKHLVACAVPQILWSSAAILGDRTFSIAGHRHQIPEHSGTGPASAFFSFRHPTDRLPDFPAFRRLCVSMVRGFAALET
jgi:hypothetical protein